MNIAPGISAMHIEAHVQPTCRPVKPAPITMRVIPQEPVAISTRRLFGIRHSWRIPDRILRLAPANRQKSPANYK
ncbi:MAG TPA: hypothetical protein PLW35_00010 [Verrucomicrobiota bacterium]|nr:hypothetical protein [Verrucomicrobiota bacterium]